MTVIKSVHEYEVRPRKEFNKRSQQFIRAHNEPLSVFALRVSTPDCATLQLQS